MASIQITRRSVVSLLGILCLLAAFLIEVSMAFSWWTPNGDFKPHDLSIALIALGIVLG